MMKAVMWWDTLGCGLAYLVLRQRSLWRGREGSPPHCESRAAFDVHKQTWPSVRCIHASTWRQMHAIVVCRSHFNFSKVYPI